MLNIFIGALFFSIWCVGLFFARKIGLSMALFIIPFTTFIIYILEKKQKINKKKKILIIPIFLLSITYLIFNNQFFNKLNIIVIPSLIVLLILEIFDEEIEIRIGLLGRILGVIIKPLSFIDNTFEKFKEEVIERLKLNVNSNQNIKIKKVIKALLITLPTVLIIIWLLASADEVFGNLFSGIIQNIFKAFGGLKISTGIKKIILTILGFTYFSCFFYYITNEFKKSETKEDDDNKKKDDLTIKMILGGFNIVYFIFCIIQIKSLFMKQVDINYSEYARKGFFQLMVVSIINLITILRAKKKRNIENKKIYIPIMCIIMILFTFIILISAAYRMYLYESAYGYTLLRLLVYCSLFTESILLIPTALYVIDRNDKLPKTYMAIIITVYVCMNFANFDKIIAKRNIDRYVNTGKIDLIYLQRKTGTDAITEFIRFLNIEEDEYHTKQYAELYLNKIYNSLSEQNMDFRDFNISQYQAKKILEEKIDNKELEQNIDSNSFITNNIINQEQVDKHVEYQKDYTENMDSIEDIEKKMNSDEYQHILNQKLLGKEVIDTEIVYDVDSKDGKSKYVICKLYDDVGIDKEYYFKVYYDENTESYLGMGRHLVSNYGIQKHEIVDITFSAPVTNVNEIKAKMFEYIAD